MPVNNEKLKFIRLRLRNWKNFSAADVSIRDRMFLVGPNASGKSNFLDAFRFLRDLASPGGGLQEAVRRRGGVKAIRCLAARRWPDVEIHVELQGPSGGTNWGYALAFHQDNRRRPCLPSVRTERVLKNGREIVCWPDEEDKKDQGRLTQTALEQVSANRAFRDVALFFASTRYSHIVPQLVRDRDSYVGRSKDPYGGDFLEQIAKIPESRREKRMKRIEKALRIAVPQLEGLELWHDDHGAPRLRGKYRHWRPPGAWQTEERFSDGTLRLIGLLWAAMEQRKGPMLLEEPELSLHAGIVRMLPQMLARAQRRTGRQMFLATHSSELLRDEGIGLDETLLLIPDSEGTTVTPAGSPQEVRDLLEGGLSLGDIVIPRTQPDHVQRLGRIDE